MADLLKYLPTTRKETDLRGWDEVDIVFFTGDAYIDHPSFGAAVLGRVLEAAGFRVAIVPQPDWHGDFRDFKKFGRPRLYFAVSAGSMDSMVNHYTAARRRRSDDAYTPEGKPGARPDYCTITYCQILKQIYPDVPVVIGGIEASMRRLTHYDYWQDKLMPSILVDSGADLLVYGMGIKNSRGPGQWDAAETMKKKKKCATPGWNGSGRGCAATGHGKGDGGVLVLWPGLLRHFALSCCSSLRMASMSSGVGVSSWSVSVAGSGWSQGKRMRSAGVVMPAFWQSSMPLWSNQKVCHRICSHEVR